MRTRVGASSAGMTGTSASGTTCGRGRSTARDGTRAPPRASSREPAAGIVRAVPGLVIGPLLRYVGATEATVWVETDGPCRVEVLGRSVDTFAIEGHHYALVF